MKATPFEYRHQTLLHLLLVGLALLSYLADPVDIVWALVRGHSNSALLERIAFGVGALIMLSSAVLDTWAKAKPANPAVPYPLLIARVLLASALSLLLPLSGALTLMAGEAILIARLILRDQENVSRQQRQRRSWRFAFRSAASKWGLALSMIVFTVTLNDRIAEIGAALSFIVWSLLCFQSFHRVDCGGPARRQITR